MTRIRTWALETGRWTRTLLPSPSIRKLVVIGLAALLVATTLVPILNFIQPNQVQAAWYNEDWTFRKGITVTHGSDEANVYTTVGMDTSDTSRFKADCSDLRFTDYNGTTIPYHIVSGCGTSETEVQLLFGTLPQGEQTVYVYYGNESASDVRVMDSFNNEATGVTATLGAEESSQGPVAAWKFDEGYGTVAHDATTNEHDGTISGATWQSEEMCPSGKCLRFDGVDDYVSSLGIDLTPGSWSMSVWIKLQNKNITTWEHIIGSDNGGFALGVNIYGVQVTNTTKQDAPTSSYMPPLNVWTHIAARFDHVNDKLAYYANGKLVKEVSFSGSLLTPGAKTRYIGRSPAYTSYFYGSVDQPKIYNYARTQQQIQQDYVAGIQSLNQQQANLSNGLVGYWKMDESSWNGTSGEVKDASGNGNNGQTINGTAVGSGKFGNGGSFDGVDDYVNLGSPTVSQSRSYAIWSYGVKDYTEFSARLGVFGENTGSRIDYGNGTTTRYHALVSLSSGSPAYVELTGGSNGLNRWSYVVLTIDNETGVAKLYQDGQEISRASWDTAVRSVKSATTQVLGMVNSNAFFAGQLDEARMYNRALSAAEVQQLYIYAPKPVAYYDFEEGAGSTVYDKSGNGNNGTWSGSGARYLNGKVGKAGSFNGGDSQVTITTNSLIAVTNSISIQSWVLQTEEQSGIQRIVSKEGNISPYGDGYSLYIANGMLAGKIGDGTNCYLNTSTTIEINSWQNIAMSFDGASMKLYLNGAEVATRTCSLLTVNTLDLRIGAASASSGEYFNGQIDELKIYNYARTPGQIVQDMQVGQSAVDSPIGHWKLDEGQGTTAHNSGVAGSALDGMITAATWDNGLQGKALSFTKTNTKVNAGNPAIAQISGDLTISAWVNPNEVADHNNGILSKFSNVPGLKGYNFGLNSVGQLAFRASDNGATTRTETFSTTGVPLNAWSHVAVVFSADSGKVSYFINGKLDKTATSSLHSIYNPSGINLEIGAWDSGTAGSNLFDGIIDEPKIYNSALSPQDILVDYNHNLVHVVGNASTDSTVSGTGQTATIPSNSAGSRYCVPGDSSICDKPVVEYDFEEADGETVKDTSGNGNDASWSGTGSHYAAGITGKSGNFDESSDYISLDSNADLNPTTITLETWVKLNKVDGSYRTFVGKWQAGVNQQYLLQLDTDNTFAFWTGNGGSGGSRITSTTTPVAGQWYHVVGTQVGTTKELYVNGVLESTSTSGIALGSSSLVFTAGSKKNGSGSFYEYLDGALDNIRLYNYARTPAQIAWDYNYGKPIARYKFDECSGTAIHDSSGNGLDGVLNLGSGGTTTVGNCENASSAWGMAKSGKYNSAMKFDGVDDYIDVTNTVVPTSNVTISMWIKPSSVDAHYRALYAWGPTSGCTPASQYLVLYNSQLWLRTGCGSQVMSKQVIQTDQWQHVLITIDSEGVTSIYRNGVIINFSAPSSSRMGQTVGPGVNTIGMYYAGGVTTGFYEGLLDDVQIFNYMLTDAQIKTLYNGGAVRWGDK